MQRQRLVVVTVLVLAAVLGAALPTLAAGNAPSYFSSGGQTLIYTASSGSQPQGAIIGGQYVRLAIPDCPAPARMLVDGVFIFKCPPPLKLPPLPRPPLRLP